MPHLGCPNDCVFCNQHRITGHEDFSIEKARQEIETVVNALDPEREVAEIAFFGGSFTGIERTLMESLLDMANDFCKSGKVSGIRLSTRPDYISDEILSILAKYPVKTVELGIQSLSEDVLAASKRGHTASDSLKAMREVKKAGFDLIGQMMVGLPCSTLEKELYTLKEICRAGADGVRIYPTVVFHKTELCEMMLKGSYSPLSVEDAAERVAELLYLAHKENVPVIRIGLCESDSLHTDDGIADGAFHPALGEMCTSAFFAKLFCEKLDSLGDISSKRIEISVAPKMLSKAIGQKRYNILKIKEDYSLSELRIVTDTSLSDYEFKIKQS